MRATTTKTRLCRAATHYLMKRRQKAAAPNGFWTIHVAVIRIRDPFSIRPSISEQPARAAFTTVSQQRSIRFLRTDNRIINVIIGTVEQSRAIIISMKHTTRTVRQAVRLRRRLESPDLCYAQIIRMKQRNRSTIIQNGKQRFPCTKVVVVKIVAAVSHASFFRCVSVVGRLVSRQKERKQSRYLVGPGGTTRHWRSVLALERFSSHGSTRPCNKQT